MRRMLGDILVKMGLLDSEQLQAALSAHRERGIPLGRALVQQHFCSEDELLRALSAQSGAEVIELKLEELDRSLQPLVPAKVARQYRLVPMFLEQERHEILHVAMAAPVTLEALDAVRAVSGKPRVEAHLASDDAMARALFALYGFSPTPRSQGPSSRASAPTLLLYGFPHVMTARLQTLMAERGIFARAATPLEITQGRSTDILLAPLSAIEALLPQGTRVPGNLIVQGQAEGDVERAQRVGARGFLASPLDTDLLLRAVRRFLPGAA